MNDVIIKEFDGNKVEIIELDGELYFEIYSTGMALGQVKTNSQGILYARKDRINENLKNAEIEPCVHNGHEYINEQQLYDLMLEMKTEKVKPFRKWLTGDVLPSIRKHGTYMTDEILAHTLEDPDFIITLATKLKEERIAKQKLELQNKQQIQIIHELKPKADYTDLILRNKSLLTITQIAKDYGMSGQALNKKLHELKIQYKQNEQWLLYSSYQSCGYTYSETYNIPETSDVSMSTKWTQKGRLFLYELLKKHGILPSIEKIDDKTEVA